MIFLFSFVAAAYGKKRIRVFIHNTVQRAHKGALRGICAAMYVQLLTTFYVATKTTTKYIRARVAKEPQSTSTTRRITGCHAIFTIILSMCSSAHKEIVHFFIHSTLRYSLLYIQTQSIKCHIATYIQNKSYSSIFAWCVCRAFVGPAATQYLIKKTKLLYIFTDFISLKFICFYRGAVSVCSQNIANISSAECCR